MGGAGAGTRCFVRYAVRFGRFFPKKSFSAAKKFLTFFAESAMLIR